MCPVRESSNNKFLPANSRAVDVAKQAFSTLTPIQQRRYDNAFQVQGYDTLVYTRLTQGITCSCMSTQKEAASMLGEDGKLPPGRINELLTGGMVFKVQRYGARDKAREDLREPRGMPPKTREDQQYDGLDSEESLDDNMLSDSTDLDDPFASRVVPRTAESIDDLIGNFDSNDINIGDVSCGICFGTGFVGGFTVGGSWRQILTTSWPDIRIAPGGLIEVNRKPFYFECDWAEFLVTLPKGFTAIDAVKVWNNTKLVRTGRILVDSNTANYSIFKILADGRPHLVRVEFDTPTEWTHVELQFGIRDRLERIDFPKMARNADMSKLDQTDDVQINASPMISTLSARDVLIEHTFGKAFEVMNVNPWNDKSRNILGWDCTGRVIQPNEVLNMLPRRRVYGQQTTHPVRDNTNSSNRRT
jgi:hypothetical protein